MKNLKLFNHSLFITKVFASCETLEQQEIWEKFVRKLHKKYANSLSLTRDKLRQHQAEDHNIYCWKREALKMRSYKIKGRI